MKKNLILLAGALTALSTSCSSVKEKTVPKSVSGIYPVLAHYNDENECGTGAVVPWANKLWVVTYGPHCPTGSSDKLYEIASDMTQNIRKESIGGTPANRMIHKESNQLFIGPYAVDAKGKVRTISYDIMPGRPTGNARDLFDPANKILLATMEEGFYQIDVHSLEVKELYPDGNGLKRKAKDTDAGPINELLPGVHGKGFYSGQGVAVFANNGEGTQEALQKFDIEAGVLAEWNGKDWKVIRRNQFTEITGPGGIYGNADPATDPIWAVGWDYKSLILGVRQVQEGWSFYRLPKASHSYDGAHGWNTEWPRIRHIGTETESNYLMTMHGMFWKFPGTFTADHSAGIRPGSAYLKVIGDFARWNNQLVFGSDDSAKSEFLNKRKAKGNVEATGQSNSNIWFTSLTEPYELGPVTAEGAVWAKETIKANEYSEPFLFAGWKRRCVWIKNEGDIPVTYTFEIDEKGNNQWKELKMLSVDGGKSVFVPFDNRERGEWIRVKIDKTAMTTVSFSYAAEDNRPIASNEIFMGLSPVSSKSAMGGLLYSLGDNRRALGLLSNRSVADEFTETGYYEMNDILQLVKKNDAGTAEFIRTKMAIPQQVITVDKGSVLIVDDSNRRWRLPLGNEDYKALTDRGLLRICREVATERDLFSCMGTFYELPAENADGYAKIRPISSHNFRINDYGSYRGMLLMTGVDPRAGKENPHIIVSDDGKAAVWAGVIDDLWKLGKPVGYGGPWIQAVVKRGEISDPYLMAFYDKKELTLTVEGRNANITMEVDPTGNGDWMEYLTLPAEKNKTCHYRFPDSFQARWIRFKVDTDAIVTTLLEYQ